MSGFLSFLGALAAPAAQMRAGQMQGDIQGTQLGMQLGRQRFLDELKAMTDLANVDKSSADAAYTRHRNRAPVLGEDGYNDAKSGEAAATATATQPVTQQNKKYESDLTLGRDKTLIPLRADAEAKAFQNRMQYGPLNADESSATTQLPRMAGALATMQKLSGPSARAAVTGARNGGFWRNYLNTPEGRQWNQAAQQAALAGAIATEGPRGAQPDRVEYFKKTYVPQAGDDDATANQKLSAFKDLMRGVVTKSGRGYTRLPGQSRQAIEQFTNDEDATSASPTSGAGKSGSGKKSKTGMFDDLD